LAEIWKDLPALAQTVWQEQYIAKKINVGYHLEFDSNWAISSNDFIQYIAKFSLKFLFIAFERKIAQKKNAAQHHFSNHGASNGWEILNEPRLVENEQ
jgi:hypothetical protein